MKHIIVTITMEDTGENWKQLEKTLMRDGPQICHGFIQFSIAASQRPAQDHVVVVFA